MLSAKILILSAAYFCVYALPQSPPVTRNTIFGDEKFEGAIFENLLETNEITTFNEAAAAYRLPTTTKPVHYDVLWEIDFTTLSFKGSVTIQLYATESGVNEIVIHSVGLEIPSVILHRDTDVIPQTHSFDTDLQFLRIVLDTGTLEYSGTSPIIYELTIEFGADLRSDMSGLYRSWYRNEDPNEEVSFMATTQFQSTSSRRAFPCYDEPSFKATFDITVRRPTTHSSWSCMRINSTGPSNIPGYEDDIYHTTPVMSTYLIAIIVAEYGSLNDADANDGVLNYEVIARPAAIRANQGEYAFDIGKMLLDEMSNHTDIDYYSVNENLKMTQASIPDFSAGAMENWGLLTYREAYLMYDKDQTSSFYKQVIAYILSHEIAHMWFGNLVTCEWWDVLWLNESFARYYEYFLTDWVDPAMGFETRFIPEQVHTALLADSVANVHPLTHSGVGSPSSISAMFSTISYAKGSCVIRMTEHLLGHEVHREGLRNYLKNRAFDVALPNHLFEELQAVALASGAIEQYGSDFSVVDYYKTWSEQGGHPVLTVQVNHQTGAMVIYQHRFDINNGYTTTPTDWIIPITFSTASNPDFTDTKPSHIIRDSMTLINRGSLGNEWVIFNKQQTGYYRVNYDDETWNLITEALKTNGTLIHEYNKAQIVNDVFQFARANLMTYSKAFAILSFLEYETEYAPWVAALTGFTWLRNRFASTPNTLAQLHNVIALWSNRVISDVTYYPDADESFMRSYLRYQVAPTMCIIDAPGCRDAATSQFRSLVNDGLEVPVDSRLWVYCNGLRYGTQFDFDFLWNRFLNHNVYTEKILLLNVLGCTPHQSSLYMLLDAIVENNYLIRRQDYTTAFSGAVSGNEGNTQIVFSYIKENLEKVELGFNSLATPLSYISARLRTVEEIENFQEWATENRETLGTSYNSVMNGAENARESINWALEVQDDLLDYLESVTITTTTPSQATDPTEVIVTDAPTDAPTDSPTTTEEPEPDSAVTSALSITVTIVVALVDLAL